MKSAPGKSGIFKDKVYGVQLKCSLERSYFELEQFFLFIFDQFFNLGEYTFRPRAYSYSA